MREAGAFAGGPRVRASVALLALALTSLRSPVAHATEAAEAAQTEPSVVYKTIGKTTLRLKVYRPSDWKATDRRGAIVFFFGGGWATGNATQFEWQCRYLASRGLIAMAADYRVKSRQNVKPIACVADAKSAIRYVRSHADELGINPDRIAAGGGSAGGHLAAAAATLPGLDDPSDDLTVNCIPSALVLFNPALVLAPLPGVDLAGFTALISAERFGCEPAEISPVHHIHAGTPATIIFHGKADATVPIATARAFRDRMLAAGNRCELIEYDGQPHGFFNFRPATMRLAMDTLKKTDAFLTSLGWISGPPQVDAFFSKSKRPPQHP